MMPKGLIALKPNSSRARQQWLRGVFLLCVVGVGWGTEAWASGCMQERQTLSVVQLETKLKQYKTIDNLEARFEQKKVLKSADVVLKSSGDFLMHRERGKVVVDWTVRKPAFVHLHITDQGIKISEKQGEAARPVMENKEAQARILRPIYSWLSMDSKLISEQFNIEEKCGYVFLRPKEKDSPISAIVMTLNKTGLVETVELAEKSRDTMMISFKDTKVTKLKDAPAK